MSVPFVLSAYREVFGGKNLLKKHVNLRSKANRDLKASLRIIYSLLVKVKLCLLLSASYKELKLGSVFYHRSFPEHFPNLKKKTATMLIEINCHKQ